MEKQYDVVIIGCGVAGCYAALQLPSDKKILIITKSSLEESDSFLAQGGICVQKGDDDYDSFFEDTLRAGHYENRRESVDIMIRESRSVIDDLISYQVDFEKENGKLRYTREAAHSTNRILHHKDITGKEITSKLLAQVVKKDNITLLDHTAMVDILCRGNCCDGILIKQKDNELTPVFAQHILWACGGIGGIFDNSTNFPHLTGDALALSLKHGIALENVNYVQIHPTTLYSKKKERRFLISESVRGEGAHLYDKNGNRFVDELLPRDVLTHEIHKQMKKDNTEFVWLSMKDITEVDISVRFPNIYQKCLEEGYDPKKDFIPVVPAQHYFMGGVHVDSNSHTSMKHLYAAGETSCNGVHGANRLASNSLLESLVFARRAVRNMEKEDNTLPKAYTPRFTPFLSMDLNEIARVYQLDLKTYDNENLQAEKNKKLIWDEIHREENEKKHAAS